MKIVARIVDLTSGFGYSFKLLPSNKFVNILISLVILIKTI